MFDKLFESHPFSPGNYLYAGPKNCYSDYIFTSLFSPFIHVKEKGHFISFYYYLEKSKDVKFTVRMSKIEYTLVNKGRKNAKQWNEWNVAKYELPIGKYRVKFLPLLIVRV